MHYCELTELISKIIMSFEDFNQVIQHAKINRYFSQDLFDEIGLFCRRYMEMRGILIR